MKHMISTFTQTRKIRLLALCLLTFIPVFAILLSLGSTFLTEAHGGDSTLIHACKDSRGRVTIVGGSENCNVNETAYVWPEAAGEQGS
jgi:hypothetical protein